MTEETLRDDVDAIRADLNRLKTDLVDLTRNLRYAAESGAHEARERLRAAAEAVGERGERAVEDVQSRIEARPLTSIAIAFGVGLLVGALLRSK